MVVNKDEGSEARDRFRCQIGLLPSGPSRSHRFARNPSRRKSIDSSYAEGHALEAKLEGQIACWGEMLWHMELWSEQASRQDRTPIVELLGVERARATAALQRASEDLDALRRSET